MINLGRLLRELNKHHSPHAKWEGGGMKKRIGVFWNQISRGLNHECWPWNGAKTPGGYAKFRINGKFFRCHRLAFLFVNGRIPKGLCVCHRCDNRLCCNPAHLFLGTFKENIHDCMAKGRWASGETHGMAKLTTAEVIQIFSAPGTQKSIAEKYKVCEGTVHRIKRRTRWKKETSQCLV